MTVFSFVADRGRKTPWIYLILAQYIFVLTQMSKHYISAVVIQNMIFINEKLFVSRHLLYRAANPKWNHRLYSHKGTLAAAYQPKDVELGNSRHILSPNQQQTSIDKFSLILPPPNITGHLHLGHALMCTIQDVLVRWKRSKNFNVNWIPGTDHAGIGTQVVVEKMLMKAQNVSRHDIGREAFLEEVWKWREGTAAKIKMDLIKMGASLNWSKEYFTMDKIQSDAVKIAFARLFNQNLIYRGELLVNWSCSLESTISDIEVDNVEINGPTKISVPGYENKITFGEIVDIAYKFCDSGDEIIISTTRPETLLGDVAIAVHPDDERYAYLKESNPSVWHPFREEKIPIIFDYSVDKEFGTGAVKITPAHDKLDYEISNRHSLPSIQVINEKGEICSGFGTFTGQKRFIARDNIKNELSCRGLLRDIKPHKLQLPMCMRSKDVIEYLVRPQWFVKCEELAKNAIQAVESGVLRIHPENYCTDWIASLSSCRDWCISRQLWWGHQVPAYECTLNDKTIWLAGVSREDIKVLAMKMFDIDSIDDIQIVQDPDVLDTWFSSALLPFSSMGWPNIDETFDKNYPLDLMVTGNDILFFWVSRMVMLGQVLTGNVPFKEVLLHGIVCDANGRKMSKSLGNVITPDQVINGASREDLKKEVLKSLENGVLSRDEVQKSISGQQKLFPNGIPECGTDALRFTLCSHNIKSRFINFDVNECHANKLFFNKIWQATRYTITAHERFGLDISNEIQLNQLVLGIMDRYILSRLSNTLERIEQGMATYNLRHVTTALRSFFYGDLCDVYLETTKKNVWAEHPGGLVHCRILAFCLSVGLENLSHFAPYVSYELRQHLPKVVDYQPNQWIDNELESEIQEILDICSTVRRLMNENNITGKHAPIVHLFIHNQSLHERLVEFVPHMVALSHIKDLILYNSSKIDESEKFVIKSTAGYVCSIGIETNQLYMPNIKKSELNKKKLEKLENALEKLVKTVSNDGYRISASQEIQTKHIEKINQLQLEIEGLKQIQQGDR